MQRERISIVEDLLHTSEQCTLDHAAAQRPFPVEGHHLAQSEQAPTRARGPASAPTWKEQHVMVSHRSSLASPRTDSGASSRKVCQLGLRIASCRSRLRPDLPDLWRNTGMRCVLSVSAEKARLKRAHS